MNMNEPLNAVRDNKYSSWKRNFWILINLVVIIVVMSFSVRSFLFTNYIVYGQSMMPTIHDGERIIVNKIGYEIQEPDRFDLIIFAATEENDYVKRVIGLPGDEIYYENDTLYINGVKHMEEFLDSYKELHGHGVFTEDFTLESITGQSIVPEGHFFVLGDNRPNSLDSRQIGFIPVDRIVGKANVSFWPLSTARFF